MTDRLIFAGPKKFQIFAVYEAGGWVAKHNQREGTSSAVVRPCVRGQFLRPCIIQARAVRKLSALTRP